MDISRLKEITSQTALAEYVDSVLDAAGENNTNETFAETANRLEESNPALSKFMAAAEARWWELPSNS